MASKKTPNPQQQADALNKKYAMPDQETWLYSHVPSNLPQASDAVIQSFVNAMAHTWGNEMRDWPGVRHIQGEVGNTADGPLQSIYDHFANGKLSTTDRRFISYMILSDRYVPTDQLARDPNVVRLYGAQNLDDKARSTFSAATGKTYDQASSANNVAKAKAASQIVASGGHVDTSKLSGLDPTTQQKVAAGGFQVGNTGSGTTKVALPTIHDQKLQSILETDPSLANIVKYLGTTTDANGNAIVDPQQFTNAQSPFSTAGPTPTLADIGRDQPYTNLAAFEEGINTTQPGQAAPAAVGLASRIGIGGKQMNWGEALNYLYTMPSDQLVQLQKHLAVADPNFAQAVRDGQIGWGDPTDAATNKLWQQLLVESTRDPNHLDVAAILNRAEQANFANYTAIMTGSRALASAGPFVAHLTDPTEIQSNARQIFTQFLGRTPTAQEDAMLTALVHGKQTGAEAQAKAAIASSLDLTGGAGTGSAPTLAGDQAVLGISPTPTGPVDANIRKVMQVIAQHESGGRPDAVNPNGPAYGKYQFLPGTWQGVLRATGHSDLVSQYPTANLAPESVQDAVALQYATSIFNSAGGDYRAIPATWYTGGWNPNSMNYVPAPGAGNKETVAQYVNGVISKAFGGDVQGIGPGSDTGAQAAQSAATAVQGITDVNPTAEIENYAKLHNPTEYATHLVGSAFQDLLGLFSSNGTPSGTGSTADQPLGG